MAGGNIPPSAIPFSENCKEFGTPFFEDLRKEGLEYVLNGPKSPELTLWRPWVGQIS